MQGQFLRITALVSVCFLSFCNYKSPTGTEVGNGSPQKKAPSHSTEAKELSCSRDFVSIERFSAWIRKTEEDFLDWKESEEYDPTWEDSTVYAIFLGGQIEGNLSEEERKFFLRDDNLIPVFDFLLPAEEQVHLEVEDQEIFEFINCEGKWREE